MNKKIPADAFSYYFSLGPTRSYEAVAAHYGVTKRGISEHARRDRWQERIAELEQRARQQADEKAQESIEEMNLRHLKEARFLQSKGLEGLKSGRPEIAAVSLKSVTGGIQLERLIRGQATERTENIENVIRRECDRWLVREGEESEERAENADEGAPRDGDVAGGDTARTSDDGEHDAP